MSKSVANSHIIWYCITRIAYVVVIKNCIGWYIMDEVLNALSDYLIKSPLWLICLALLLIEGNLILLLIYGFKIKRMKKIKKIGKVVIPLAGGVAFSGIVFLFQNFAIIIESKMTLQLMETNMLSSILLSFAIIGAISIIVLPIRERKRLKGDNGNNGN